MTSDIGMKMSAHETLELAAKICDEYAAENRRMADECDPDPPTDFSQLTPERIARITAETTKRLVHIVQVNAAVFIAAEIRKLSLSSDLSIRSPQMPQAMENMRRRHGDRLDALREHAGLSMEDLAKLAGFSGQSSIQRYLHGYTKGFRPEIASRFKAALIGKGNPAITEIDLRVLGIGWT